MGKTSGMAMGFVDNLGFFKTCHKTFLNCFALELSVLKTKQLRNILGHVLMHSLLIQSPSSSFEN
jgi:hypothetical protein